MQAAAGRSLKTIVLTPTPFSRPARLSQQVSPYSGGMYPMKKTLLTNCFVLLAMSAVALGAATQPPALADSDTTRPSYDMKPQSLLDLETMQKKFVDLANAIPADKLTWRPSPDARSFAEVFLHVSAERYGILHLMGVDAPAGFDGKALEKSTTDRAQIVAELNKSWEFAQKNIN